ncbi:uncharacterized protein V1513DRAFT_435478 [Lipomyces chichibuensis]|uniref:uncharacterized protein n=1 Tax=Lipomyces chichibuensis TaxID=1546026 RepID=UPI003343C86A
MENKATEQGGATALPVEMTAAEATNSADSGTAQSNASADNTVPGPAATVPTHSLSKSTHMKTKKPAPLGPRNIAAAASQRPSSASSRQQDRIVSLTRSTAASAARTTTSSAATASARERTTTFNPPSRLLAPTEASKAHASAPRNAETRPPIRSRPRASAPSAVGNSIRPVQKASTKSAGARPFAESTASSLRLSSIAGSKPLAHTPREDKAVRTLRNEVVHIKPEGPGGLTAEREAKAAKPHHENTAEELVIAAVGSAHKTDAMEDKTDDADTIERDKKMSELSAELDASTKKLHDSTSIIQQQADNIAGLKTKCCEYEQKITELEKELAVADEKHDAAIAKLQNELISNNQMHVTEIGNLQSELSAYTKKHEDQVAVFSEKLVAAEEQINLRERELEGNSKVIKSLQEELNTTVENMEEARKAELEKLAKSYDGWRDKAYVDGLQKELETLRVSAQNDTEISSLKKTISDLEAKKPGQKDLITALETKVEVLTATIESQGEQNTILGASNESLSKEVEKLVRQLSETKQELQDVLAQHNQLEALATVLESEKATADKNMADMRQIFGELERNVDSLNSELRA